VVMALAMPARADATADQFVWVGRGGLPPLADDIIGLDIKGTSKNCLADNHGSIESIV